MLDDRSDAIVKVFKKYVKPKDTIMELGCSSGRNLVALSVAGFKNLTGLEMYPVNELKEFKLIRGRYEDIELDEYDVIFSASFLQEFETFPQEKFNETLKKCRKYFMIFGDYLKDEWKHPGFKIVETIQPTGSFSQPLIILCKI